MAVSNFKQIDTHNYPACICLFKLDNGSTRMYKILSKLTIKTPEGHHLHCSGIFIVKFEQISHIHLVFP